MKVIFCLALLVAYVACEQCSTKSNCDHETCDSGWTLDCVSKQCTCTLSTGGNRCVSGTDCRSLDCSKHTWSRQPHCVDGQCRCTTGLGR